jgi:competence protein J (ComJ)
MEQQTWEYSPVLIYSELTLFLPDLPHPFNHWSSVHGDQGFSWRPGSVSFGTIDSDGPSPTFVEIRNSYALSVEARRVIKVPFEVGSRGVVLSDPIQQWEIPIPAGHYALFFSIEPFGKSWQYHITFVPTEGVVKAEIIRADEVLSPPEELLMEAEPM